MPTDEAAPPQFEQPSRPADLAPALRVLIAGDTLSCEQAADAFEVIMSGAAHAGEIGALLGLLATRVPTGAELLGAARVMRRHVDPVKSRYSPQSLVDTAGTGGARKTFNVSTAAAIIAASAVGPDTAVAKHGNRSRTGRGSAEVLAGLGVNVDADRATQSRCLDEARICFCFAIHHHPAAKHAMPVRAALGFPTIFNLLGPLTNPAGARRQIMGVYDRRFLAPIADALSALGAVRAMVVYSDDGLDELSITAATTVMNVRDGSISEERIDPAALGIRAASLEGLVVGDLEAAVELLRNIIGGSEKGPAYDMTMLNTAATLLVADTVDTLEQGLTLAAEAVESGAARETLENLVRVSNT